MIYLLIFWILMAAIVGIRVAIMTSRAQGLLHGSDTLQYLVAHLHMGYFIAIALLEILSSGLLIKLFRDTHRSTLEFMSTSNILQQLIRTTEMRLATLALIGTGRSITYSFQTASQEVTSLAGQFDRFLYTMECLFPFIMLYVHINLPRGSQCFSSELTVFPQSGSISWHLRFTGIVASVMSNGLMTSG